MKVLNILASFVPIFFFKSFTNFFTEDGKDLKVNPGNTFISVFPKASKDNVKFKKPE